MALMPTPPTPTKWMRRGRPRSNSGLDGVMVRYPFRPRSPYAVAKSAAFWQVANYREAYDLFTCTGILFNHESPLRPERFVTQKIIAAACRIANGSKEQLHLGNISIVRDWGYSPEYVEAMWLMLQNPVADDFVIATGHSTSLKDFISIAFEKAGLNWENHVVADNQLFRPTDIGVSLANPTKAKTKLGWSAKIGVEELIGLMMVSRQ